MRELKRNPETNAIRVIVMSGSDLTELPEGVDRSLRKPVQQPRLLRVLTDDATAQDAWL